MYAHLKKSTSVKQMYKIKEIQYKLKTNKSSDGFKLTELKVAKLKEFDLVWHTKIGHKVGKVI